MKKCIAVLMVMVITIMAMATQASASPSAGLYWGPVTAGNLKLYVTNPHFGYAGPKVGNATHINFHVDKSVTRGYTPVANFHVTKYQVGSRSCLYVWESEHNRVVVDNCMDSWRQIASTAVQAMKDFVKTLLDNANWLAFLIIVGVLTIALIAVILTLPVAAVASEPGAPLVPVTPAEEPHADHAAQQPQVPPAPDSGSSQAPVTK